MRNSKKKALLVKAAKGYLVASEKERLAKEEKAFHKEVLLGNVAAGEELNLDEFIVKHQHHLRSGVDSTALKQAGLYEQFSKESEVHSISVKPVIK